MAEQRVVVGVFKNEAKARNALDLLREVGFSEKQVEIALKGEELAAHHIFANLVNAGVPEEEVNYYRQEFEVGRSIVSVHDAKRPLEALNVLLISGTRIHKYFHVHISTTPIDLTTMRKDFSEVTEDSVPGISSKQSPPIKVEETMTEEMPSWMRILKDAGLDYLI